MVQLPIDFQPRGSQSLQESICGSIRDAILARKLVSGTRLPSSRDLAESLSVSRNTVVLAYERLAAEGYIEHKGGVGTFVSLDLPEECFRPRAGLNQPPRVRPIQRYPDVIFSGERPIVAEKGMKRPSIDFWYGRASHRVFPIQTWRRLISQNLGRAAANIVEYPAIAGLPELRMAIAKHVALNRGVTKADWRNIIVTSGAQEAFDIIGKLFVKPGTSVMIESPCYQGLAFALQAHGAKLVPVQVDQKGMNIDDLEVNPEASLVCVTPSHQFPTGATLPLERRLRMIRWAERVGAYIVEDDYDSDFRYSDTPLPAMAGLADGNERVIYVGTFSKSLGAGLRAGYMLVPPRVFDAAICAKALSSQGHSWLDQAVLADFLETGGYRQHLRRLRQAQKRSRDALIASLRRHFSDCELSGTEAGMHLMWRLPFGSVDVHQLAEAARKLDVGIYPPSAAGAIVFHEQETSFVLGYPALTQEQIGEGISRVKVAFEKLSSAGG